MLSEDFPLRALSDVVGTLHREGATGRLDVHYPKTPGTFHFRDGKLVDAQIGTLVGFQAIHLAVSLPATSFDFEPLAEPQRQTITDASQDLIFDFLLRPSTIQPVPPAHPEEEVSELIAERRPAEMAEDRIAPEAEPPSVVELPDVTELPARPPVELPVEAARTSPILSSDTASTADERTLPDERTSPLPDVTAVWKSYMEKPAAVSYQRRALLMVGAIAPLLIVAVAVVSFTGRTPDSSEAAASDTPELTIETPDPRATLPEGFVGEVGALPITQPPAREPNPQGLPLVEPPLPAPSPRAVTRRDSDARKSEPPPPGKVPAVRPSSTPTEARAAPSKKAVTAAAGYTVTVVMQVVNGRVAQASVANPRPGMEAYEASALRIARQRRFPPGTAGQEKLQIKIDGPKQ